MHKLPEFIALPSKRPFLKLVLVKTTIPAQALRTNDASLELILPTFASVFVGAGLLSVEAKLRDASDDWSQSDDPALPTATITIRNADVLRLQTGGNWRSNFGTSHPTAILLVRDPLAVQEELSLTLASVDGNNPDYWIDLLAKLVRAEFGVLVAPF